MKVVGIVRMEQLLEVGEYHWITNERVVFKLVESKPWEKEPSYYGELFGVDVDGDARHRLGRLFCKAGAEARDKGGREIDAGREVTKAGTGLSEHHGVEVSRDSASAMPSGRPTSHHPPLWIRP